MTINKKKEGGKLTVLLEGRLDTVTSPDLEAALAGEYDGADELVLDLTDLAYISSAGLRVLLSAQKKMAGKGGMTVTGVNETVNEIFDITGFSDILTVV